MIKELLSDLEQMHEAEVAKNLSWFFKTKPGEYGHGDVFVGIKVPQLRALARKYSALSITDIKKLASSKFHEYRFCALVILVKQFEKGKSQSQELFNLYMQLMDDGKINNWDLVDVSAPRMGVYLLNKPDAEKLLTRLAKHQDLWHQRLAVMFTAAFINRGDYQPTIKISKMLLNHPHDLIHKATGWMLREVGKKDIATLKTFLGDYGAVMPRTMLRYAIEKLPEAERKEYLAMKAQLRQGRGH